VGPLLEKIRGGGRSYDVRLVRFDLFFLGCMGNTFSPMRSGTRIRCAIFFKLVKVPRRRDGCIAMVTIWVTRSDAGCNQR
jgi:hypothetical protein